MCCGFKFYTLQIKNPSDDFTSLESVSLIRIKESGSKGVWSEENPARAVGRMLNNSAAVGRGAYPPSFN